MLVVSCNAWLDVTPENAIADDDLFSTGFGYRNALNGIYTNLASDELYGKQLSWGFLSAISQQYNQKAGTISPMYADASELIYNTVDTEPVVTAIWEKGYKVIANLNKLIENIRPTDISLFEYGEEEKNLIYAEALSLRAMMHFDLLRLYGPVYSEDPEMKCLPWRTEFNADQKSLESAGVIAQHILEDLTQAEELLKDDPLNYKNDLNNPFLGLRKHRMNKMAVKALMARVYLWIGDKENAALKAKEVIEQCGLELVISNIQDASLYDETIFCLGMDDMANKLKDDWKSINTYSNELYISYDNANTVFERTTIGLNDIRYRNSYGFIHGNNGLMCRKYLSKDKNYSEKIPLIRLSEMYYILAESVSLKESVTYINKVRNARGISRNNNIEANDSYDEAARKEALNKEYQKDFFAEGQYFYFLKRHNYKTFWRCPVEKMDYYVLPTPDDEIAYGNGK